MADLNAPTPTNADGAAVESPELGAPGSVATGPAARDMLRDALTATATRAALGILSGVVLLSALLALGASVWHLMTAHMQAHPFTAGVTSAVVALAPLVLAVGAVQTTRERTRAALAVWFVVWALVALALAAVDGVLSARAIVVDVAALTNAGRILAPLPGALAVVTIGAALLTLRGDDDAHALGGLMALIAKAVLIGFSSFGLLNLAAQSEGVKETAFAVFVAAVVETSFVALLVRGKRGPLVDGLTWLLGVVLGLNATETTAAALGLKLPDALAWIPEAGAASVVLSGFIVTLAAVALSLAGKHEHAQGEHAAAARSLGVGAALAGIVSQVRAALASTPADTRPAVQLAKDNGPAALELSDIDDGKDTGARAEVSRARPKSRGGKRTH